MIWGLLSGLWGKLALVGAGLAATAAAGLWARKEVIDAEHGRQAATENANDAKANKAAAAVDGLGGDAVDRELRQHYTRLGEQ